MAQRAISSLRLFVGNLAWTVSKKELGEYFSNYGRIRNAVVLYNRNTGLSKGYGFIQFESKAGFDAAVAQDNHAIDGTKVLLSEAGERKGRLFNDR